MEQKATSTNNLPTTTSVSKAASVDGLASPGSTSNVAALAGLQGSGVGLPESRMDPQISRKLGSIFWTWEPWILLEDTQNLKGLFVDFGVIKLNLGVFTDERDGTGGMSQILGCHFSFIHQPQ